MSRWDNWGEYYMERTPEEIRDLRAENRAQNKRLEAVEQRVAELRVALVGIDDQNGLRGELREHKENTSRQLSHIEEQIDGIGKDVAKSVATVVGVAASIVGIIAALVRIFGG